MSRKHRWRSRVPAVPLLILTSLLFLVDGVSGLVLPPPLHHLQILLRIGIFVLVIAISKTYLQRWQRAHSLGVKPHWRVGADVFPELQMLSTEELLTAIEPMIGGLRGIDTQAAKDIAHRLMTPENFRRKVIEDVVVRKQQTLHNIRILWYPASSVPIGTAHVVPVMRPRKNELLRELTIDDGRLLGSFETITLLFVVCTQLAHIGATGQAAGSEHQARTAILELIADPGSGESSRRCVAAARTAIAAAQIRPQPPRHRCSSRRQNSIGGVSEPELEGLLNLLSRRKANFVTYDGEWPKGELAETRISYRADTEIPPIDPDYDHWRKRKDGCRRLFRLPPRHIYINLGRSRSADSFELHVGCDDNLFVEETNVWSCNAKSWLQPQPREHNYEAYIGWEKPSGKAFASLGAAKLAPTRNLKNLWFALRLTEKPPGILAPATTVAFATLMAIWLVAVTTGSGRGGPPGTDLVALVLALPAVGSTGLGLYSSGGSHGLRSMTGLVSLAVSLLLSISAISMYLVRYKDGHLPQPQSLLPHKLSIYLLRDYWWIGLVTLAAANCSVVLGTLLMRLMRYGALIRTYER